MFEHIISYQAKVRPDALAVIAPDRLMTFKEFDAEISLAQRLLATRTLGGGTVGVALAHPVDHWAVVLAMARMGVATFSLAIADAAALEDQAQTAGISWIIADTALHLPSIRTLVFGPNWRGEAAKIPQQPSKVALQGTDLVRVTVSSGSTGKPKLIGLRRDVLDLRIRNAPLLGPLGGGRLLSLIGIANWAGYFGPLLSWATSGAVIFPSRDVNWAKLLSHSRPELVIASPMHLAAIVRSLPKSYTPYGLLRMIVAGGAVPLGLAQRALAMLTPDIFICYASTECGFSSYGAVSSFQTTSGAAGYVLPWSEVQVVDEHDGELPSGEIGRIRTRGVEAVQGYLGDEKTGDFRDGWFYPGDQGALSAEGLLTIAGREGEVMNCGGIKISPLPIEDILLRCEGVRDAAAVAISRPGQFDLPVGAVVATENFSLQQAQSALETLEHDIRVVVVPEIPRTAGLAKVRRDALREMVAGQIQAII